MFSPAVGLLPPSFRGVPGVQMLFANSYAGVQTGKHPPILACSTLLLWGFNKGSSRSPAPCQAPCGRVFFCVCWRVPQFFLVTHCQGNQQGHHMRLFCRFFLFGGGHGSAKKHRIHVCQQGVPSNMDCLPELIASFDAFLGPQGLASWRFSS